MKVKIFHNLLISSFHFQNKKDEYVDFDENSVPKQQKPLIWRSLKEYNLTDNNEKCRNSLQGINLIVDERGFVCDRADVLRSTQCCNLESYKTRLYYCDTCNDQDCCEIYEYCVSCCLDPEKVSKSVNDLDICVTWLTDKCKLIPFNCLFQVPMLEKLIAKASDRQKLFYSSLNDQFELCLNKCRTNSHSVMYENKYQNERHKYCFGHTSAHKSIESVI